MFFLCLLHGKEACRFLKVSAVSFALHLQFTKRVKSVLRSDFAYFSIGFKRKSVKTSLDAIAS